MHTRFDCWALGIGFGIALTVACVDKSVDAGANDVASDSGDGPRRRPARSDSDPAELPRVMIDTKMVTNATGSRRIMVHRGEDLQRAIDQAGPGDVLLLEAGAEFPGSFTLPAKDGSGWITIRSSAPDDSLPPEGTRLTPAFSRFLPRLVTTSGDPAVRTADGAHHYRLMGLEITAGADVSTNNALVELGGNSRRQRSRAQVPHHLIIDRAYVHGHRALDFKRCIAL